jgi:hypothetical protein
VTAPDPAACPTCGRLARTIHVVYEPVKDRHLEALTAARLTLAHAGDRDDLVIQLARALVDVDQTMRAAMGKP